jgi:general secretion pathway protein H
MRAAAADVAGALRRARGRAIALDRPVLVVVDAARGSLSVDGLPPVRLPAGVGLSAAARDISFAPDGSTSGGRVMLADGARRVLVGVDWLTGRVSIADAP